MQYHEFPLSPPLTEYIQSLWAMEPDSGNEEEAYPRSQIMPDGIVEIVFHYGDPFYTYQDGVRFLQPDNFAISMMKKYVEIESSGKTGFIAARFFPWGAYHFFNEPVQNFLDQTIDAVQLWGDDSRKIIEALKVPGTMEQRFKLAERFLLDRLQQFRKQDTQTDEAIKLIRREKGRLSIEEAGSQTGFSKKQLERKFLSSVGTTPKVFSRICRFLNICRHLEDFKGKNLTELTYECGFYDQAHFIKEFKEFSGFTPKAFFEKENVYFSEI
jgi:AraC-like DNA-binding protein